VPAFVDTNVAVYALGRDSDKKTRAKQILDVFRLGVARGGGRSGQNAIMARVREAFFQVGASLLANIIVREQARSHGRLR
jgi:hypothetical protein